MPMLTYPARLEVQILIVFIIIPYLVQVSNEESGRSAHFKDFVPCQVLKSHLLAAGVDPGILERGFICIKVWGFALLN